MSHVFHHHPDGRIIIQAGDQHYTDTLENFAEDYPQSYSGLPDGIKEFRYTEDGSSFYITDKDVQVASEMDMDFVWGAIQNIRQIIANQERRLSQVVEEADPDTGQRRANEQALKQLASSIGIDTDSSMWRDALLIKIAEAVFKQL